MQPEKVERDGKLVSLCLNCGKEIPPGNRKYCSVECSAEFFAKHNQRGLADLVYKREHATCQSCGWKNPKFSVPPPEKPGWVEGGEKAHRKAMLKYYDDYKAWSELNFEWEKTASKERRSFVADHITPIALGGAEFDLENIQLLCEVCDRKKTREDKAKIAKRRKLLKRIGRNGKLLDTFLQRDHSEDQ